MLPFSEREAACLRTLISRFKDAFRPDGSLAWNEAIEKDFQQTVEAAQEAGPSVNDFTFAKARVTAMLQEATDLELMFGQAASRLMFVVENLYRQAGDCVGDQFVSLFSGKALRSRVAAVIDGNAKDDVSLRFCCRSADGDNEVLNLKDFSKNLQPVCPPKAIRLMYLEGSVLEELSRFRVHRSRAVGQLKKLMAENETMAMTLHISLDESDAILADYVTEMLREIKVALGRPLPSYALYKAYGGSLSACIPFAARRRDPRLLSRQRAALQKSRALDAGKTTNSSSTVDLERASPADPAARAPADSTPTTIPRLPTDPSAAPSPPAVISSKVEELGAPVFRRIVSAAKNASSSSSSSRTRWLQPAFIDCSLSTANR